LRVACAMAESSLSFAVTSVVVALLIIVVISSPQAENWNVRTVIAEIKKSGKIKRFNIFFCLVCTIVNL